MSAAGFNYEGAAILLSSFTTSVVAIVTLIRAGRVERRQERMELAAAKRDQNIHEVKELVNGQSKTLNDALQKVSFADGEKFGISGERANPMVPAQPQEPPP